MKTSAPRLIVVISFDQMRGDMPDRFDKFFGEGGFRRIRNEGKTYSQCYYQQANMMTGPGHAVLLTGKYPKETGIVTNDFCDASMGACMYCAADTTGTQSPFPLFVETVTDELRADNEHCKVVSIALKDRAAVLMGGQNPTAAVWVGNDGAFTTSSFYKTPTWLPAVASQHSLRAYAGATWESVISENRNPAVDNVSWEGNLSSGRREFPHPLADVSSKAWLGDVLCSPYSARVLFEASASVVNLAELGADEHTDVLCIGVSTTDFVGHVFGPDSREVQETYVACDNLLSEFLVKLDSSVGAGNYTLIITSDHGVAPIPEMLTANMMPGEPKVDAGRIPSKRIREVVDSALSVSYGQAAWVLEQHLPVVYLNTSEIAARELDLKAVVGVAVNAVKSINGIAYVIPSADVANNAKPQRMDPATWQTITNAYHPDRSGELLVYPKRYWIFGSNPATHGTFHDYDRWVPLMMMGKSVERGSDNTPVEPTMIAPIIRALSH